MDSTTFTLMVTTVLFGFGIGFAVGMVVAKNIAMKVVHKVLKQYNIK